MFNFFKKQDKNQKFINQVVGGQSVIFRIFKEVFEEDDIEVNKAELTYFALSVFTYTFLRLSKATDEQKEITADEVALAVLKKSIPYASKEVSLEEAALEYQKRYQAYNTLINVMFKGDTIDSNACTTLMMHLYECVMGKSAEEKMIKISVASPLLAQYVADHVDFMKTVIEVKN